MKLPEMNETDRAVFAACYARHLEGWPRDGGSLPLSECAHRALTEALHDLEAFQQAARERFDLEVLPQTARRR
jgi:hypothetical protein